MRTSCSDVEFPDDDQQAVAGAGRTLCISCFCDGSDVRADALDDCTRNGQVTSYDKGTAQPVESATYTSAQKPALRLKGIFDPKRVRFVSFTLISIALFGTALLCVLAIWDYASRDTAWRALATFCVLAATAIVLTVINERFGTRLDAYPEAPADTIGQPSQERRA